jgi:hypothetical protein
MTSKIIEKEFVPNTEALALKELGFDNETCFGLYYGASIKEEAEFLLEFRSSQYSVAKGYVDGILAPTFSQSFRWFRKPENGSYNHLDFMYEYLKDDSITYEEAELKCLVKLIEIKNVKL